MKKRSLMTMVLVFGMLFILAGCAKKDKFALVSDKFTHELGEPLSEDIATYVKANKTIMDKSELDIDDVYVEEVGSYAGKVIYNGKDFPFTVEIVDTQAPKTALLKTEFEVEAGEELTLEILFEEIVEHDELFIKYLYKDIETDYDILTFDEAGEYDVTAEFSDPSGNKSIFEFKVMVSEIGYPIFEGLTDMTIGPKDTPDWLTGVTVMDSKDGDLTSKIKVDLNGLLQTENGEYEIYYSVEDSDGNEGAESRFVIVEGNYEPEEPTEPEETEDTTIPEIKGMSTITINLGDPMPDLRAGVTAHDAKDGDLTAKIEVDSYEVDLKEAGEYEVYYSVLDKDINEGMASRFIIIVDPNPPTEEAETDSP